MNCLTLMWFSFLFHMPCGQTAVSRELRIGYRSNISQLTLWFEKKSNSLQFFENSFIINSRQFLEMHESFTNQVFARNCDWNIRLSGFKVPYWGWAGLRYIYNIYCMHEFLEVHFFDRNEYIVVKFIGIYELWNLESNFFDTADIVV